MEPSSDPLKSGPASPAGKFKRPPLGAGRAAPRPRLGGDPTAGPAKPAGETGSGGAGGDRPALVSLSWADQDVENRWGIFKGGRYTSVNKLFCFLVAATISTVFLALMFFLYRGSEDSFSHHLAEFFVRSNNLPATVPATLFFFLGMVIVVLKIQKLALQRRALDLAVVPQHQDFALNETTARTVLERMRSLVDDTRNFILLNRIDRALSGLHNIGGISDVSTILKGQADNDENQIAASYALINAMVWAIPVLGFVGTVLGLKLAMSKFNLSGDVSQIKESLGPVVSGLSTAFETTLVGLVFALLLHLFSDLIQQKEMDFLDECNDYCHANVLSKLRVRGENQPPERPARPAANF
jgi:biopolymer transport protein ExbB/TolQ